jgi:tetratricopeptide (TPR) repeat protein
MKKYYPYILLLVGCLAYTSSFRGAFIFDDTYTIVRNVRLRHVLPQGRAELLSSRALTDLTFAANYATGGLNPADYHAVNLLVHLIAGLLLYGVVRRTLRLPSMETTPFYSHADHLAFVSAMLWVVHPLTTSAVTYVSQRYECMMGMFYLLVFYSVIRGATSVRSSLWYCLAILACLLGMASKEVMVTAPVVLLIYDRIFLASSWREVRNRRWWVYAGAVVAISVLVLAAISVPSGKERGTSATTYFGCRPSILYALTECGVILQYLKLSFLPYPLCFDYSWELVSFSARTILEAAVVVSICAVAVILAWHRPRAGFLGLWFFAILAPTSSVFPRVDCAFEHRMYLSLAGLMVAVVVGAYGLARLLTNRKVLGETAAATILGCSGVAVIMLFSWMTYTRNCAYVSGEVMWRDIIATRPQSVRPYINLSGYLLGQGRYDEVVKCCEHGLKQLPDFQKTDIAELRSRIHDPDVDRLYRQVLFYSRIHNNMGLAFRGEQKPAEAIAHFEEAMRLAPDNASPQVNLAGMKFACGQTSEAIAMLRHAADLEPGNTAAHECLGNALRLTGDTPGAVKAYEAVLALDPDNVPVLGKVAWIRATDPDAAVRDAGRAVVLAEKAAKAANYLSWGALDTLAAAYAEAGRYDEAVRTARKALELAEKDGKTAVKQRLDLYSAGKPYRDQGPSKQDLTNK